MMDDGPLGACNGGNDGNVFVSSALRIALIGTTFSATFSFRGALIRRLVADGYKVFVYCNDYNDSTRSLMRSLGAYPVDNPLSRAGMNPIKDMKSTKKLSQSLKGHGIQKVFCYTVKPVIFGSIAAHFAGVKHIVAMLEGLGYAFTKRPRRTLRERLRSFLVLGGQIFLYHMSLRFVLRLIVLNEDDPKDLARFGIKVKDTRVLGPIGVPSSFFDDTPYALSCVTFLFVGRLLFDKGISEFVHAAQIVKEQYPDVIFKVCGDVDKQNPASLSRGILLYLDQQGVITYVGHADDVRRHLQDASVLVLPSYREGYPRVVQEAMAVSRPVIVTDVPGCRDAIIHGEHGFVIPPFSAEALAECMIKFIQNPHLITSMGEQAHTYAVAKMNEDEIATRLTAWILSPS